MQNFNKKFNPAIHHKHFKYHSGQIREMFRIRSTNMTQQTYLKYP